MHLRWLGVLTLGAAAACAAMAQPPSDEDPLDDRHTIRGVEPMDYLGYFEFLDRVSAKAIADQMPELRPEDPPQPELVNFTVATQAALRHWSIRVLSVRIGWNASGTQGFDLRLKWPSDTRSARARFPFAAIRRAFEGSRFDEASETWIAQRDRMWPDIPEAARQIGWSETAIDVKACPTVLADLRQFRDAPPGLELIPSHAALADKEPDKLIITADGWSVSLVWNGGPNQYDGGRANPDQNSALGGALLQLVDDAVACTGLEETMP